MTVTNETPRTSVVGSGSTGQVVPFLFAIKNTSDIEVRQRITATAVESTLVETTNYTVSINGDQGGSITTVTAIASSAQIHIIRATPKTQALDLNQGGPFSAENQEDAFDKNMRAIQDNADAHDRTLRVPVTDPLTSIPILPSAVDRASKFLFWDANGIATAVTALAEGSIVTTTFGENFIASATALAAKAIFQSDTIVDIRDYGVVGDGVTDDTTNFNLALVAAENKTLELQAGGTYNLTSALNMVANTKLEGNGSTLNFTIAASPKSQCLAVASHCVVRRLTVNQLSTTVAGDGSWANPIGIGHTDQAAGTGPHHILIEDVTVSQATPFTMIGVYGDSHDIIIRNVIISASTTALIGILVHWAWDAAVEDSTSHHPYNIVINNVTCDGLKKTLEAQDSYVVLMSGAYNCHVSNVYSKGTWGGCKVQVGTPGDTFAGDKKEFLLTGITIQDCVFDDTKRGIGSSFTLNSGRTFSDHETSILFRNIKVRGEITGNACTIGNLRGVTIEGCRFENANQGIRITDDTPDFVNNTVIRDCIISGIQASGINIGASDSLGILIENCLIEDVHKAAGGTAAVGSCIITDCPRTHIRNCTLGATSSEGAIRGVTVTTGGVGCVVEDVHVRDLAAAGFNFQNDIRGTVFKRLSTDDFASGFSTGVYGIISSLADEATPSVRYGDQWQTGGTTTITDFDDGVPGQTIEILAEHSVTITHGTNIFLSGRQNWAMEARDTLTLTQFNETSGLWFEVGRSHNRSIPNDNFVINNDSLVFNNNQVVYN